MYANAPKRMLLPAILDILSRYTDVKHPLSQKELIDILEKEYYMKVDRKTLGRNLQDLMEYDDRVHCNDEKKRFIINKETGVEEETSLQTDFYMDRLFDDTELQVLIYNVLFSKHIPQHTKGQMLEKLESLGTRDFHIRMNNFAMLSSNKKKDYNDLFLNMELLNEAINDHKKVSFQRKYIGSDKFHFIQDKTITLTPFKIASSNNEFYVLGTVDWFKRQKRYEIERFRIDSLTNMQILEEPGVDLDEVYGIAKGFDFNAFLSQSPTIVPGEQIQAKMTIGGLRNLSAAIDYFGHENIVSVAEEEPNEERYTGAGVYTVTVRCVETSLYNWAANPFNWSYVVEPASIREMLAGTFQARAEAYNDMDSNIAQSNKKTYSD